LGRDLFLGNGIIFALVLMGSSLGKIPAYDALDPMFKVIFYAVGLGSIAACFWLSLKTKGLGTEWKTVLFMGLLWLLGAAFYLYEPIAGMTNPPMEWGYPRTLEGFFHALSRGQYNNAAPTDIIHDPGRFMTQLGMLVNGLADSFSWVYFLIALLPFFFLLKMQKRERSWIIGLGSIYLCVGVLLTVIMNTSPDRQSADESKVFFAASHAVVAIMIGYGLALMTAYMATHYGRFRRWGLAGGAVALLLAVYCLLNAAGKLYFGPAGQIGLSELPHWVAQAFAKDQYGSPIFANLILVATAVIFIVALLLYRNRAPVLIALCLFMASPVYSGLSHWYKSEQRNHWFGYWFGHDMFTPPFGVYPEMARDSILFGGTDPGRFCPTYMIFCESFIPHRCQPVQDQKFDRRDVYIITQNALADGTYLDYLRAQYNRSMQQDPPFFREFVKYILGVPLGEDSSIARGVANVAYNVLDVPFTKLGAHIEARRRAEGVYPKNEIYIPTPDDSQDAFQEYTQDVARRQELGQLRPGEDVNVKNGQVQVSGNVAVMMINGLLCKVIFDHNPTNEFYVEESFPLDWMYPYETPSGVIMKINRNPLPSLPDEVFKKDHEFWSKYSDRLIGNWITYDTTIQQIADFAEKIYVGNNYAGFKGDRKFIRDDGGQKAFSKLRSSIAGMYAWRLGSDCPPEYRPKNNEETQALIREADFAFKQAFAFCPYSPEAVFRYANFLLQMNRLDDALIVARTCLKLDPYNDQVQGLIDQMQTFKKQNAMRTEAQDQLKKFQDEAIANPSNFQNILALGSFYSQIQDTNMMVQLFRQSETLFDQTLASSNLSPVDVSAMAQIAARIGDLQRLEGVLEKLISLAPAQPEPHYDLAVLDVLLGKNSESLKNLQAALDLSAKRLLANPSAHDLLAEARHDPHFDPLRNLPEFQKIVPPN
jgi:tetratricopeptide (TPR) repeat protein